MHIDLDQLGHRTIALAAAAGANAIAFAISLDTGVITTFLTAIGFAGVSVYVYGMTRINQAKIANRKVWEEENKYSLQAQVEVLVEDKARLRETLHLEVESRSALLAQIAAMRELGAQAQENHLHMRESLHDLRNRMDSMAIENRELRIQLDATHRIETRVERKVDETKAAVLESPAALGKAVAEAIGSASTDDIAVYRGSEPKKPTNPRNSEG